MSACLAFNSLTSYPVTNVAVNITHSRHDVGVTVSQGAVLPSEGRIDIEFGVGMHGRFRWDKCEKSVPYCMAVYRATRLWWISEGCENIYSTFSSLLH